MEKMFGPMMQGFINSMSKEDNNQMKACFEKMTAMCPSCNMKDMPEGNKKTMMEKMNACCGSNMK
ncbi:MAG: hypothetical protein ABSG75_10870 [Syntrophales bacterium]|jgi:hypothetical protein